MRIFCVVSTPTGTQPPDRAHHGQLTTFSGAANNPRVTHRVVAVAVRLPVSGRSQSERHTFGVAPLGGGAEAVADELPYGPGVGLQIALP